jgi:hypothetical protein
MKLDLGRLEHFLQTTLPWRMEETMTNQQKFLLGAMVGAVGALAGRRLVRGSREIDFSGRVVVVTGGSRGLGLEIARRLTGEGARLCLLARNQEELARAADQFPPNSDVMTPGLMRTESPRNADMKGRHEAEYAFAHPRYGETGDSRIQRFED